MLLNGYPDLSFFHTMSLEEGYRERQGGGGEGERSEVRLSWVG